MLLVQSSLLGGIVAVIAVVISGIGWLPNFVLWSWAWITSSTVALGQGSSISLNSVTISQLPAWPWFGLIPTALPSWTKFLIVIPILLGVLMALATRNNKISIWIVSSFFVSLGVSATLSLLGFLSSGSLGSNLLLNFGVSPKEIFQRNMTWFLIGQVLIIGVVFAWRKNRQVKQQPQEMSETEEE
jgi:hypothetical protein